MFSPKSMPGYELYITKALPVYGSQMDAMIDTGKAGRHDELGRVDPRTKERQRKGEAAFDAAKWSAF
jgi:benzoate 4-monooxygenase